MTISPKRLGSGEEVLIGTRTHIKVLFLSALLLIVIAAATGFLLTLPEGNGGGATVERWAIVIVALGLLVVFVVLPFLRWLARTYTLTNRRLIARHGLITRRGRDIPLARISDVSYEMGLLDRVLGCGTLVVSDATEQSGVVLKDIPDVERFHLTINELLFPTAPGHAHPETRRFDDGT